MPVDPHLFATFIGVMAVMAVTPGPANLFAIATGAQRGRRAALLGVAGMNVATLVWFGAAALGLGALVAAFPAVFRWVAVLGGLYVAWLGLSAWRRALFPPPPADEAAPVVHRERSAFRDGFAVQLSNPKAVLFFTAVLPPFIDPTRPTVAQLALFAVAMLFLDAVAMSAYAVGGAALAERLRRPRFRRGFDAFTGTLLLLAAGLILLRP